MVQFSGKQLAVGTLALVAISVGLFYAGGQAFDTMGEEEPDEDRTYEGQFAQIGLAQADLEDPFASINGFETITVDDTATNQELTGASFHWAVPAGTDIALEERTAVAWHEVDDGGLEDVEYTLNSGADTDQLDRVVSAQVYDYEAAEDNGQLNNALVELEVDSDDYSATSEETPVNLEDGEYAAVVEYKFDASASAPGTAGNTLELHNLTVEGDSDDSDAVEMISGATFAVEAE